MGTSNVDKGLQACEAQNPEALEMIQPPHPGLTLTASFPWSRLCFDLHNPRLPSLLSEAALLKTTEPELQTLEL